MSSQDEQDVPGNQADRKPSVPSDEATPNSPEPEQAPDLREQSPSPGLGGKLDIARLRLDQSFANTGVKKVNPVGA